MSNNTNPNWDLILDNIKNEKCILLLGPEICVTKKGKPFEEVLIENLKTEIKENKITYYENEELFYFIDGKTKSQSLWKIKKIYEQEFDYEIYRKIARIPFHLIISITPDHSISDIFNELEINAEFEYYNKRKNTRQRGADI